MGEGETADSPSPERTMEELIHEQRGDLLHGPESKSESDSMSDVGRDDIRSSFRVAVGGLGSIFISFDFSRSLNLQGAHCDVGEKLLGHERTRRSESESTETVESGRPEPEKGGGEGWKESVGELAVRRRRPTKKCSPHKHNSVDGSQQALIVHLPILLELDILRSDILSLAVLLDLGRPQLPLLSFVLRLGDGLGSSDDVGSRDAELFSRVSELDILDV